MISVTSHKVTNREDHHTTQHTISITECLEGLQSTDKQQKVHAIKNVSLASADNNELENAIKVLVGMLKNDDADIVIGACQAIARARITNAVPTVAELLSNPDSSLRVAAATSLGQLGGRDALQSLLLAVNDASVDVWESVCGACSSIILAMKDAGDREGLLWAAEQIRIVAQEDEWAGRVEMLAEKN